MDPYTRNNPRVQFTLDLPKDPNHTNSFTKAAQTNYPKNHNISHENKEKMCQILNLVAFRLFFQKTP